MEKIQSPGEVKISFVVPVYNVKPFLDECLDSITNCAEPDDEIILIDDGSTDGSSAICQKWASSHPTTIALITQKNQGLSAARNNGTQLAKNEYVLFMDSDDVVNPNAVRKARLALKNEQPDILLLDFNWWHADTDKYIRSPRCSHEPNKLIHNNATFLAETFRDGLFSACSRIFKRDLLRSIEPNIFPVGRSYEEIASIPRLTKRAKSFYYLPEPLFNYRTRDGSITRTKTRENCLDLSSALSASIRELSQCENDSPSLLHANMACARLTALALQDCGRVSKADTSLYAAVLKTGLSAMTISIDEILKRMMHSEWPDASKTIRHLRAAQRSIYFYAVGRTTLKWWKEHISIKSRAS